MKVAVSAMGPDLEAQVDPRFGRAQFLIVVDTESMAFEAIENPNVAAGGGAGIQTAQMIAEKGAEAVLTGNCGPNAYQTLSAAGIAVHVGASGAVRDAVERFKRGEFQAADGASVPSHFGMGGGMGTARATQPAASAQDLTSLKQQAEGMRQQLAEISQRIEQLEKR